jgi:hypothetical protein
MTLLHEFMFDITFDNSVHVLQKLFLLNKDYSKLIFKYLFRLPVKLAQKICHCILNVDYHQ